MKHILASVNSNLHFLRSGEIVEYIGMDTEQVTYGDFFVIVGFVGDYAELGKVTIHDLNSRGLDAVSDVTDNLMVTLSVNKEHWHYFKNVVFIS